MTAPTAAAAGDQSVPGRPARPGGAAYWARVAAIADEAPPLTDEQKATIRLAIHGAHHGRAAA